MEVFRNNHAQLHREQIILLGNLSCGLWAAIFFSFFACTQVLAAGQAGVQNAKEKAERLNLSEQKVWHALLHLENRQPQITDPRFLLTVNNFSPAKELEAFLEGIFSIGQPFACRFPARTLWVQRFIVIPQVDTTECPEIREFIEKAPFERLDYVYADESVIQPASILGHSFLRISGRNETGWVEHAVSFYTNAETYNLPKLVWETLISGKRGFFTLSPYREEMQKYSRVEQRNMWIFEVRTNPETRDLIRNHLFELKNSELTYFFHRYNCATLLQNILSLSSTLEPSNTWWSTPKQVAKDLSRHGGVLRTSVILTDPWIATQLARKTPDVDRLHERMSNGQLTFEEVRDFDETKVVLARAINRIHGDRNGVASTALKTNEEYLSLRSGELGDPALEVNELLNPLRSPGERLIRTGVSTLYGEQSVEFELTPVSHDIMQLRNSIGETEMKFMSPRVLVNAHGAITLQNFTFFSMKSYNVWNSITRPYSIQAEVRYGPALDVSSQDKGLVGSVQFGRMLQLGALQFYGLLGPGFQTANNNPIFGRGDVGVILPRESNKTKLSLSSLCCKSENRLVKIDHSIRINTDTHLVIAYARSRGNTRVLDGYGISLMRSF